ncbi:MAG: type II toxin-antitoxin system HicB family antitoxin [Chthoniobacteraceae bacterium]
MKSITYCVYREDEFFVAQCLNVDVSSFGHTRDEALANLREAVELYFEDAPATDFTLVSEAEVGQELVHA